MYRHRQRSSSAPAAVAVAVLLPVLFLFGGAVTSSAQASPLTIAADAPAFSTVLADDTAAPAPPPDPAPEPTETPTPTEPPISTAPPVTPEPTVEPTPEPTTPPVTPEPTVEPSPSPSVEPAPIPVETIAPEPEESDDSDDGSGYVEEEPTPTPTPTETATVAPVPVVTQTAEPAPVINLPFYPPASASTARDVFPFAVAGVIAALLLVGGIGAYLFTRWRVRRIRYPKPRPGETLLGASAMGSHLLTSSQGSSGVTFPWNNRPAQQQNAAPSFALGFAPLAATHAAGAASNLAFTARPATVAATPAAGQFALGFIPLGSDATPAAGPVRNFLLSLVERGSTPVPSAAPTSFEVFDDRHDEDSAETPQYGLRLAPRAPSAGPQLRFDLGLPGV